MNRMKRQRLYYLLSAILLFCFSGTFLLMPVAGRADRENVRAALGTVGVLFWLTGIGGYTLLVLARRLDAGSERAERKAGNKKRENTKPDFLGGRAAVALDIVIAAGVVTLLVWSGKWFMQRYGAYVVLFITTMAFHARLLIGSRPGRGSKSLQVGQKANQDGKAADQGEKKAGQDGKAADQGEKKAGQDGKAADQGEQKANQDGKAADQGEKKAGQDGKAADQGERKAGQDGKKADQRGRKTDRNVKRADQSVKKADQGKKKTYQGGKKDNQGGKKGTGKKDVDRG